MFRPLDLSGQIIVRLAIMLTCFSVWSYNNYPCKASLGHIYLTRFAYMGVLDVYNYDDARVDLSHCFKAISSISHSFVN